MGKNLSTSRHTYTHTYNNKNMLLFSLEIPFFFSMFPLELQKQFTRKNRYIKKLNDIIFLQNKEQYPELIKKPRKYKNNKNNILTIQNIRYILIYIYFIAVQILLKGI